MTKFEKETRHQVYVFIKKQQQQKNQLTRRNARQQGANDAFCPRVNCPFKCPITLSNYKHDAHNVLLVLKSAGDNQSRSRILL